MNKPKASDSGCCSCSHDYRPDLSHENHNHDHSHNRGQGDFNLKQELIPVISVVVLFVGGLIFEEKLHNTRVSGPLSHSTTPPNFQSGNQDTYTVSKFAVQWIWGVLAAPASVEILVRVALNLDWEYSHECVGGESLV